MLFPCLKFPVKPRSPARAASHSAAADLFPPGNRASSVIKLDRFERRGCGNKLLRSRIVEVTGASRNEAALMKILFVLIP